MNQKSGYFYLPLGARHGSRAHLSLGKGGSEEVLQTGAAPAHGTPTPAVRPASPGSVATAAQLLPSGPPSVKRAHLDRRPTGDGGLAAPRQRLVQVSGFQHPKTAHGLLGLQVRPVGDEHPTIGPRPQRPRAACGCRPPTKILTPAAFISSLRASISRDIASSSADGS
jgi:hypothetical protein